MMDVCKRAILTANLVVLMLALPARAQLQVGENASMNLNANLSFGYNGDYSNLGGSDHSLSPAGNADLSGYYYNPNFLSFDIQPFFGQSRTNSNSRSVFQSSGVGASAAIFSGSAFPGTITYSKFYNSSGQFDVPGQANLTTRDNGQNLGFAWGLHLPDYPNINVQFMDGDNNSSFFGTSSNAVVHAKSFGVHASHTLDGFNLIGGYQYSSTFAETPEFLVGEPSSVSSKSVGNTFDAGVSHRLPFHGSASAAFSRSDVSAEESSDGSRYSGTIDTAMGGADFQPVRNLDTGVNVQYTNNLTGMLYQSYVQSGTVLPATALNYATDSLDVNSHASYLLPNQHLTFTVNTDHRQQTIVGSIITSDTFNEVVTYGNEFFGGFLNAVAGVTQTLENTAQSSSSKGMFDSVSYQRQVKGFSASGSFNYSRNTQTVIIGLTTSGYGYSGGIGRKLSPYSYVSFNAVGTKSTYSNEAGAANSGHAYTGGFTMKRFSLNGSYSDSQGLSILTPTGLTTVTTPIVSPLQSVAFGGKSYSFGASTTPRRGLVLSAAYSDAKSNTAASSAFSENTTRLLNGMLQYKVRQLWITGGYLRLQQGFTITGQPPMSDSSFFVGITRWFKFF